MEYVILILCFPLLVFIMVLSASAFRIGREGMKTSKILDSRNVRILGREYPIKVKTIYWIASFLHHVCGSYIIVAFSVITISIISYLLAS
jgi:hypothetical protein